LDIEQPNDRKPKARDNALSRPRSDTDYAWPTRERIWRLDVAGNCDEYTGYVREPLILLLRANIAQTIPRKTDARDRLAVAIATSP
jgi:hypothetical protein